MKIRLGVAMLISSAGLLAQGLVEGRAGSPVRVLIYEDLQCPDCASFRVMMDQQILPKYGGRWSSCIAISRSPSIPARVPRPSRRVSSSRATRLWAGVPAPRAGHHRGDHCGEFQGPRGGVRAAPWRAARPKPWRPWTTPSWPQ